MNLAPSTRHRRPRSPCFSTTCDSSDPGITNGAHRHRTGSSPSASSARNSSSESSSKSIAFAPVSPVAAIRASRSRSRSHRSANASTGRISRTSSTASSSSRSPVGLPSPSQTTLAPESNVRGPVIPATSSARELTNAECASNIRRKTGTSGPVASTSGANVTGAPSKTFGSSPHPSSQPVPLAAFRITFNSGNVRTPERSTPRVKPIPATGWACPSTSPGVIVAAPRSSTSVCGPRHARTSARSPTAVMRPAATASAVGRGPDPMVWIRSAISTKSAAVMLNTPHGRWPYDYFSHGYRPWHSRVQSCECRPGTEREFA